MKRRLGWLVLGLVVVLGGAPFLNADRFGPRIRAGLESALGRKVEIGAVRIHLLTGPGFSVRKVLIHERPEISAEPFAYVDDLVVRIRILSLLAGRLEFSSLRLDKPHVNLMRRADGAWNFRGTGTAPGVNGGTPARMPELQVRRGRLNFKLEDRKSAYYFTDADIDFSSSGEGTFDIWFVGEMARTDRMARGLGRVTAQGRLRDTPSEPRVDLQVQLERSALQELAQLAGSPDLGVQGAVKSRAEISGPVSALQIKGQLDLTELHHWTQPPRAASVSVGYTGTLALGAQTLVLETDPKRPLRVNVKLERFLTQPAWRAEVAAKELSMAPMAEWLRPPGADFNGMKLAGWLDGGWVAESSAAATGSATLAALDWTWGEGSRLQADELKGEWRDGVLRLSPAKLELDGQPLQVECDYRLAELAWECRGASKEQHELKKLQRWMKALGLRAEWVEDFTAGQIRGALTVGQVGMEAPVWKGQLEVRSAELVVPELAVPVKVTAATVLWQQQRLTMPALRASVGGLAWSGSYRYEAGAVRPHRLSMDAEEVELEDLERVLGPLWRGTGFLSRALGMGGERRQSGAAEAEIRAHRVGVLENVRATVWREGEKVTLQAVTGEWRGAKVRASGVVRLGGDAEVAGRLTGLVWEGGVVESDWRVAGRGRLMVSGTARMTGGPADWLRGAYKWDSAGKLTVSEAEGQFEGRRVGGRVSGDVVEFDGVKLRALARPFGVALER
ncbi:MAG: AsmA family protein [Acidobacteria bacterium]|nr:AsmA family protein [Acidobacteriota bacterium]